MSKWSSAYRDSRWQKKRLEVMERDGFTCCSCGKGEADGTFLNVHHAYYEKGNAPWEYPADTLYTLCDDCHSEIHKVLKRLMRRLSGSVEQSYRALGYSDGLYADIDTLIEGNEYYYQGFSDGYTAVPVETDCEDAQ